MQIALPPLSSSAHAARAFAAAEMSRLGREHLADDVATVVSELVANAVMHARTELVLDLAPAGEGVRLTVTDGSAVMPRFVGADLASTSGRGLLLVDRISARWGVDRIAPTGKVVWVEIDKPFEPVDLEDTEDLIAMWAESFEVPASSSARTVVVDVSVPDLLASRHETDSLIRELQLLRLNATTQVTLAASSPQVVALAQRLDEATEEFDDARRQLLSQALTAERSGELQMTLALHLEPSAAPAAVRFLQALEDADSLVADGVLLVPRSTEATMRVRRLYVRAIVEQLTAD